MTESSHDAYIFAAPEQFHALLLNLRNQLSRALPDAKEVMQYKMPGFHIEQMIIAGYPAFSKQCGLYVDPGKIAAHAEEIENLKLKATKTGVTFSANPYHRRSYLKAGGHFARQEGSLRLGIS